MSRDNSIFFYDDTFPLDRWENLLSIFNAANCPCGELDRKHLLTHKWSISTKDDRTVHVDLGRLHESRHCFPEGYRWHIGIHCNSGIPNWFLYSLPMLATVSFADTILWDPHPPNGFVTCDLEGILKRAAEVVPSRCRQRDLIRRGYTTQDSMWPTTVPRQAPLPVADAARDAARQFSNEMKAEFYPEPQAAPDS